MDTPLIKNEKDHEEKELENPISLVKEFGYESKRLWKLAGPAILTSVSQFSMGVITRMFTGLVGELELATVSVQISVIAGLAFGIMVLFYLFLKENILSFVFYLGFSFLLLFYLFILFWNEKECTN